MILRKILPSFVLKFLNAIVQPDSIGCDEYGIRCDTETGIKIVAVAFVPKSAKPLNRLQVQALAAGAQFVAESPVWTP